VCLSWLTKISPNVALIPSPVIIVTVTATFAATVVVNVAVAVTVIAKDAFHRHAVQKHCSCRYVTN